MEPAAAFVDEVVEFNTLGEAEHLEGPFELGPADTRQLR
jgi:hypothetical protein